MSGMYKATTDELWRMREKILDAHRTGLCDAFLPLKWHTLDSQSRACLQRLLPQHVFTSVVARWDRATRDERQPR